MNYELIDKFINETTEQNNNYKCSKTRLYNEYCKYYNNINTYSKKDFNIYIESKFNESKVGYYKGLQMKYDQQFINNFLSDEYIENVIYKYPKKYLYIEYLNYCKSNNNIYPYLKSEFNNIIESKFGQPFKSGGKEYYIGFQIKEAQKMN